MTIDLPNYSEDWQGCGFGNHILYRMCADYPSHDDLDIVRSKLWLIGRSYSAAPTRGIQQSKAETSGDLYEALAAALCENGSADKIIKPALKMGRIGPENMQIALMAHYQFNNKIVETIKGWQSATNESREVHGRISFSSKYLHFHAPNAFFLYDSVILDRLRKSKFHRYRRTTRSGTFEPSYARLCEMLLKVTETQPSNWTPRSIDKLLYPY